MKRLGCSCDILADDVANFDDFCGYAPKEIEEPGVYEDKYGDCYLILPVSDASEQHANITDDGSDNLVGYKIPDPYPHEGEC